MLATAAGIGIGKRGASNHEPQRKKVKERRPREPGFANPRQHAVSHVPEAAFRAAIAAPEVIQLSLDESQRQTEERDKGGGNAVNCDERLSSVSVEIAEQSRGDG
ncbi:hypothetical protein AXG93_2167s1140 [Marchantia polymorpha subsp. ruderalis]|uniref:Uncharacterized protein n=1 Tax=Marchantia polymorpha subsp. ruderalis TaxID=1480154 RepID=A0A176W5P9_MARPO|nr:hypothetical protein AXG93_2167s1140 [Marchantia polymorpha subsp. ruderalis]